MSNYNPFSLEGKTIFVTGASSGIGRAIAIECSRMGAKVVITGRNVQRLDETFSLLEGEGHSQFIADLTNMNDITDLVAKLPELDGIVNSAGIGISLPFQFCSFEKSYPVIDTNLVKPMELIYRILKLKKNNKRGFSLVFISSIAGIFVSYPGNSVYSAAKAGIVGLAKGLAIDLASKNIRVNSVCPGMIETSMADELAAKVSQEAIEADKMRYPLKRYGKPEEVAHAVIYLLSDASSWVTGSSLLIDGGFTLQ
ncbi:SDR family oxidoreductase [Oscillospiraceae bacterium N12]|jgi:NAD(P)-dependent dehydrogenase (short-subunit alcohol dehydrogenase family)|uniref:SDR family oxidoreductase n=1 Tax=Jilunia laotingensis TaxID=2763675 RepID=A0A926F3N1_9BACT|nr:SDR family oxidoreductase [Jilunia laotingensis]MBC8594086.1 SDR family oxidoreductase [Jilunia laotingensis]